MIASHHKQPWRKQFNLLAGYLYFYNVLWLLVALGRKKTKVGDKPVSMQLIGILGLAHNIYRTLGWAFRLMFRKIERVTKPPASPIPVRSVGGGPASHALSVVSLTAERSPPPGRCAARRRWRPGSCRWATAPSVAPADLEQRGADQQHNEQADDRLGCGRTDVDARGYPIAHETWAAFLALSNSANVSTRVLSWPAL